MKRKYLIPVILLLLCFALSLSGCFLLGGNKDKDKDIELPEKVYDLSECGLRTDGKFEYDGTEKKPDVLIFYNNEIIDTVYSSRPHSDIDISYKDNIDAGTATATLTAKSGSKKFKGSGTATFIIEKIRVRVSTFGQLKDACSGNNTSSVTLEEDITVPQNQTLELPSGLILNCEECELINYGKITNNAKINLYKLYNYGEIINGQEGVVILGDSPQLIYNTGDFTNSGVIKCYGWTEIYTVSPLNETRDVYSWGGTYLITDLKDCIVELSQQSVGYKAEEITPAITIKVSDASAALDNSDFVITYKNNINVGTATVTVDANPLNRYTFGSVTLQFEITETVALCGSNNQLKKAFADDNYRQIKLVGDDYNYNEDITVPQGKTLILASDTLPVLLINNGTVVIEQDKTFTLAQTLTNNGVLNIGGNLLVNGSLVNSGSIVNSGNIYQGAKAQFTLNKNIENHGKIFVNAPLSQVTNADGGTVTVRQNIANANVVSLSQTEFDYDGTAKRPDIIFANTPQAAYGTAYSQHIHYLTGDTNRTSPMNIGTLEVTVDMSDVCDLYYGQTALQYTILPVTATVNSSDDFATAFASENYNKIIASGKIVMAQYLQAGQNYNLLNKPLEIDEGASFTLMVQLKVAADIINNGKIICRSLKSDSNTAFIVTDGGELTNNGVIYFNDEQSCAVAGDGEIYVRKHIADDSITCDYEHDIVYTGYYTPAPTLTITLDGQELQNNTDYTFGTTSVSGVGAYPLTVRSATESHLVWGEHSFYYNVLPGTTTVTTASSLQSALSSQGQGNAFNWGTVIIGDSFECKYNIFIPRGVTVDAHLYELKYSYPYTLQVAGQLLTCRPVNADRFSGDEENVILCVYDNYYTNGIYKNSRVVFGKALIMEDLSSKAAFAFENELQDFDLHIDLQGHTLPSTTVTCAKGKITVVSTGEKGAVRNSDNDYASLFVYANDDTVISFENIYIGAAEIKDDLYKTGGTVKFTYCDLVFANTLKDRAGLFITDNKKVVLANCNVQGYCGIRAILGKISVTNCTISAWGAYLEKKCNNRHINQVFGNAISLFADANQTGTPELNVTVKDSVLVSTNGYGVYVCSVEKNASHTTYGTYARCRLEGVDGLQCSMGLSTYSTRYTSSPVYQENCKG